MFGNMIRKRAIHKYERREKGARTTLSDSILEKHLKVRHKITLGKAVTVNTVTAKSHF